MAAEQIKKTICSWDVGIKNLAYCVIEQTNDTCQIKHWNIINLSNQAVEVINCCGTLKPKTKSKKNAANNAIAKEKEKVCNKSAKYFYEKDDIKIGYCNKHKSQYEPDNSEKIEADLIEPYLGKETCCFNGKKACDKKAKFCLKQKNPVEDNFVEDNFVDANRYYCSTHKKSELNKMTKAVQLQSVKSKINCAREPIFDLSSKLFEKLDLLQETFANVDEVLIENQPAIKNPTMKTISALLYSYFIIRGVIDKKSVVKFVKFISPSNKLKINKKETDTVLNKKGKNEKEVYDLTKNLSIKYCKIIIKDDVANMEFLESFKKKDDLCDSFLQGYHYLFKDNENTQKAIKELFSENNSKINKNIGDDKIEEDEEDEEAEDKKKETNTKAKSLKNKKIQSNKKNDGIVLDV